MTTMLYDPPADLVNYVLEQRKGTKTSKRAVMKTLTEQWARIVDGATFAEINTPIYIERNPKTGRLKVEFDRDPLHMYDGTYGPGVVVTAGYHGLTEEQANRYLNEYIAWLKVEIKTTPGTFWASPAGYAMIGPADGTSRLRQRAFESSIAAARRKWGFGVEGSRLRMGLTNFDGSDEVVLNLGRMFWILAYAKDLNANLTTYMREAFNAGRKGEENPRPTHSTREAFQSHLLKRRELIRAKATEESSKPTIENLPIIDLSTPAARTWGIEVEAAGARGVYEPSGWERKDDGSLRSAYSDSGRESRRASDCPDHDHNESAYIDGVWVDNPDWSDPDYCDWLYYDDDEYYDDDDTAEFVSPVLVHAGSEGLKQLVTELAEQPQNDSAGVHVHVGASDLTAKQVGALVYAYATIEPFITEYYRRDVRNYCKDVPLERVADVVGAFRRGGKNPANRAETGSQNLDLGDRYYSVNLWALSSHGTIEFRAMGPVYEYDHLIKWALFCREMVSIAKLGLSTKVWDSVGSWEDVERILRTYGPEIQAHTLSKLDFEPAKYSGRDAYQLAVAL